MITITWCFTVLTWSVNLRKIKFLKDQPTDLKKKYPFVSIIYSARNEEEQVGAATFSLLNLDYPSYEVIAVNDRSTDATYGILKTYSLEPHSKLKLINVKELPSGWLGKIHGLHTGFQEAKGEWLLFTDADVKMNAQTLSQALHFAQDQNLDHLVVFPELKSKGILEDSALMGFLISMSHWARPWKLSDPKSHDALGVGAFNLIRREPYIKIGTHRAFPLSVIDDVELGRRVKKLGLRQNVLIGKTQVSIRWQKGFLSIIRGLEKNAFAALLFSPWATWVAILILLLLAWSPYAGLYFLGGLWGKIAWVGIIASWGTALSLRRIHSARLLSLVFLPVGLTFMAVALFRSMVRSLRTGTLEWRGTHYSLSQFKKPSFREALRALLGRYD